MIRVMKKTFYLFALLLLCAASGCNKPGIGYLYADKAAYSIDTMRIVRISNMQNKIANLQEIFQSYPSHITKLMSETDELQKDYDVKEKRRQEMYDEFNQLRNQYNNALEADKPYYQLLMDSLEKVYIHWKDTVLGDVGKAIRDNKSEIVKESDKLGMPDPYDLQEEIVGLQKQLGDKIPWTSMQIEQILGTEPLIYSLAKIESDRGENAAADFARYLTVIGGGRIYVDSAVDSPEGMYYVSLLVENEGHSALLENVFTFIIE